MNKFKPSQVIMLPTRSLYNISLSNKNNTLVYNNDKHDTLSMFTNQHLYITSDDEIKEGDWSYNIANKTIFQADSQFVKLINQKEVTTNKKIIATTDASLARLADCPVRGSNSNIKYVLPQPSQQFITKYIEEYNKGNIITDVLVEMEIDEEIAGYEHTYLKVNHKDNTITIKKSKDSFNREEMKEKLLEALQADGPGAYNMGWEYKDAEKWIKENL